MPRRELGLGDEPKRRARFDPAAELSLVVRRDEDDRGRLVVRGVHEATGNIEAALLAEADVDEHQVGTKAAREAQRLVARSSDPNDRDPLVLQHVTRLLAEA